MKAKLYSLIIFFCIIYGYGQQFSLLGDAVQLDNVTYRLTQNITFQKGMITSYYPVDLENDFIISFQLNFGAIDTYGADGFSFVLTKVCNPVLVSGVGLGADGINNSIVVEFDTYQNNSPYDQDPYYDHLGIYKDGLVSRTSGAIMDLNSNQPVRCATGDNIEDGNWHNIDIKWFYINSTSQKIEVYLDGVLKQSSTQNHILNRFINQKKAFWSVTAATGSYYNVQQVKVSKVNNIYNYSCGQSFTLLAPDLGSNYNWSPSPISIPDPTKPYQANFIATSNQTITCNYTDYCGDSRSVAFNIVSSSSSSSSTPTFSFLTDFCQGDVVPVLPTTSDNGFIGIWSPTVVDNNVSGDYTFKPNSSCAIPKTVHINIKPKPITTNITTN